eukprot:TRINITY_DN7735_c0_g1_i1.p1 TRINITY_DN7735_c0_g1~~TRINITY_DN7735_c0_g1_i1.p1  ORF type:complete len:135 (+),score=39.79 TRINITY_DN7735_c0_g1_i1:265-669(+)
MFGECPRVMCERQKLLPFGQSETPGESKLKTYCAKCTDVYEVDKQRHEDVDGAFFGPNFAPMFVKSHSHLFGECKRREYVGRVFGFKLHKTAVSRPERMEYCTEVGEVKKVPKEPPLFSKAGEKMKVRKFIINI